MYTYPSPAQSPSQEYQQSAPKYGVSKPSYVSYQGNETSSSIPNSPLYIHPSSKVPTSPIYKKPAGQVKYTAEAQLFKEMMLESESGASKASATPKPEPAVPNSVKEDARWSLMKNEDFMPIKDLASGLEYYTDGLCDQERTVQEIEIALQRRVDEMNAAAPALSYDVFRKKYDSVELFQKKLQTQLREYLGAAKLLEANLVIRNDIGDPMLVFQAEAAVAEAAKLKDGLSESASKANELMNTAHDVAEAKLRREEVEAAPSFDEVDEMVVDSSSDVGENVDQGEGEDILWTDEEFEAELIRPCDEEAAEKLTSVVSNQIVDTDVDFLAKVLAVECPAGLSPYDCISPADKDRFDDMLLGLSGVNDNDESDTCSNTETVDLVSPPTTESLLSKTDLNFGTDAFTGFNAGLKPIAHKPKVSSPLAAQPVLTTELPVHRNPEPLKFDFSSDRASKARKGAAAYAPKIFNVDGFSKLAKDLLEYQHALTSTRKRSRLAGDDTPVKKAKSSHDLSASAVHNAPEHTKVVDFLSGDRPSDMMSFSAGGLLTAELLEADGDDEFDEVLEAPTFEPLTANRKRSCSDDISNSLNKLKTSHEYSVPEGQLDHDAPEAVKIDFLSGDRSSGMMNFSAGGLLTAEFLEADHVGEYEPLTSKQVPVHESLNANGKRSRSDDSFIPSKKAKLGHEFSNPELDSCSIAPVHKPLSATRKRSRFDDAFTPSKKVKLGHEFSNTELDSSNIAPEAQMSTIAPEIQTTGSAPEPVSMNFSPATRPIKALKGSRSSGSTMKLFQTGAFADALKDNTVVEPLSSSRKRSCTSDGGADISSVKHSSPPPCPSTPLKKTKLSPSTTELVKTLLFDINAYIDGQLSLASSSVLAQHESKGKGKHAAKVTIWRDAMIKASGVKEVGTTTAKVGGKKDGLGGLREKYLASRGGKIGGLKDFGAKMARV